MNVPILKRKSILILAINPLQTYTHVYRVPKAVNNDKIRRLDNPNYSNFHVFHFSTSINLPRRIFYPRHIIVCPQITCTIKLCILKVPVSCEICTKADKIFYMVVLCKFKCMWWIFGKFRVDFVSLINSMWRQKLRKT